MATNPGLKDIDLSTPLGQLRSNVGDTVGEPIYPPSETMVDYRYFSDAELFTFLRQAGDSVLRATSFAFSRLAVASAMDGASIRTNDLGYDDTKRGSTLLEIAKWWADEADKADNAALDESLEIVAFPGNAVTPATPWVM